jgi:hypothetical protein
VVGKGSTMAPGYAAHDGAGAKRPDPPAMGALEP